MTPGQCVTAPTVVQLEGGAFALPALASGQFYEIVVTAVVTASGSVTNTASVQTPSGTIDSNAGNNAASETDTVTPPPTSGSGGTPPGSGTTPPGSGTTPPGSGTTPPGSGTTPPGSGTTPPGVPLVFVTL